MSQPSQPSVRTPAARPTVLPRTDVLETPEALILVADVPGVDASSIELELAQDVLTLRARPVIVAPEGWQAAGSEFELPNYARSFRLRADIEPETPVACVQNGRLRVVLKKRQPRANRIEVKSA